MILTRLQLQALAAAIVLAAALGAMWWAYRTGVERGQAKTQAAWLAERARLIRAAELAQAETQAESARRARAVQEIADDADQRIAEARDARAVADAAAERLRQRVAAVAARCGGPRADSAVAAASAPAAGAGLVLADVLGRMEARGRELAALADARGAAGAACERAYGALTP